MNQIIKKIHKCSTDQKRTAKAAISCLMLLLLYGCAGQGQTVPAVTVLSEETDRAETGASPAAGVAQETTDAALQTEAGSGGRAGTSTRETVLTVYVCGAVKAPGVYELPADSRVYEAVGLAGGMLPDAAPAAVNQAELLTDGQMIVIPTKEEQLATDEAEEEREEGLVNINAADLEELKTLPGIGDSKARSIVAYREKNGAFQTIDDIKNVEGIGDGVFAKLENCIKVD